MTVTDPLELHGNVSAAQKALDPFEKPTTFRYAILPRLIVYLFITLTLYLCWATANDQEWTVVRVFGIFLALQLIPLWAVTAVVRVDNGGIRQSRLFGIVRREVTWEEIQSIDHSFLGAKTIRSKTGKRIKISFLMRDYSQLVKMLAQKRPDRVLSGLGITQTAVPREGVPYEGIKEFHRNQIVKHTLPVMAIVMFVITAIAFFVGQWIGAIISVLISSMYWNIVSNGINTLIIEGNRMTLNSMIKSEEYTSQQITNIEWMTTYSKRGREHHISMTMIDGNYFSLYGFAGGDRRLYEFLRHWWAGL